jgi:hypothetical protein
MSESKKEELVDFQGRKTYPEVAAYFETQRQAEKVRDDAHAAAAYVWEQAVRDARYNYAPTEDRPNFDAYYERRHPGPLYEPYQVYTAATNATDAGYREAVNGRREGLRTSVHPEVKWIEANALSSEQGYSEAVLKALPVDDPSELWEIKRRYNMCAEFDRLYAAAELDGVFNNGKKVVGARQRTALNNWVTRSWGGNYARQLMQQLSPLMKEIEAEHAKELADAKAEWQGLDEAWRSERSRRGAATRAANAAMAEARGENEVEDNTGDVDFSDFTEARERPTQPGQTYTIQPLDPGVLETFRTVSETEEKVDA